MSDLLAHLETQFKDTYRASICPLSDERWGPGMLANAKWWSDGPEILGDQGLIWDMPSLAADKIKDTYPCIELETQILDGSFVSKSNLGGSLNLPQLGISVSAQYGRSTSVKISVSGIRAKAFANSMAGRILRDRLVALRQIHRNEYEWVHGDMLITQAYYFQTFTASFRNNHNTTLKAAFEAGDVRISPQIQISWEDDNSIRMSGSSKAPVAVRGVRIDFQFPDYRD